MRNPKPACRQVGPKTTRCLTRREFLTTTAGAGLAAAAVAGLPSSVLAAVEGRKPNILFVYSDQHQFRMMGCAGDKQIKTPNLDALAAAGARCAGISNSPLCMPYRASLVSGQVASHTGILVNTTTKRSKEGYAKVEHANVGTTFKNAGYATAYVGKSHLPVGPAELGFEYWALTSSPHEYFTWSISTSDRKRINGKDPEKKTWNSVVETDLAIDWLKANAGKDKTKPFCMFLSWGPPHSPFVAPAGFDHYKDLAIAPNVRKGKFDKDREGYYGMIEALDGQFGRLMKELEALGVADDTIVVYSSDHGEMMGARGDQKKRQPFRESSQVPLLVRWTGHIKPGTVIDAPIGCVDVQATLAGLAGLPAPAHQDGTDRSGWLTGKDKPAGEEPVFMILDEGRGDTKGAWRGVRTTKYNYARTKDGPFILFDIEKDPYEQNNLVGKDEALVKKFDAMTLAMMVKYNDQWPAAGEVPAQGGD